MSMWPLKDYPIICWTLLLETVQITASYSSQVTINWALQASIKEKIYFPVEPKVNWWITSS
jgi:hypothetical protein